MKEPNDKVQVPAAEALATLAEILAPRSKDRQSKRRARETDLQQDPGSLLAAPTLLMLQGVYREILEVLTWPPEKGGLLIGPKAGEAVTHFHFDAASEATGVSLTFDHVGLNEALRRYVAAGLDCKGYVHVHPPGCDRPSYGDLAVVQALFAKEQNRGLECFLLPIVCSGRLHPYVIERGDLDQDDGCVRYGKLVLF